MKVGIIGFGRLGKLIAKNLAQDFTLLVYDKLDLKNEIEAVGATCASLEEVCATKIIIPFVPISEFENTIKEISTLVADDSLVVDVCSVKIRPIESMKKYLAESVQILGTHPMFGPDSAETTLMGCKIVLCKERITDVLYRKIKSYLERFGLKVIEATADQHDREISESLLLTHFLGRSLSDFGAGKLAIDTVGYRRLMKILCTVENDSWQLFEDMNTYNPYAKETIDKFLNSQNALHHKLF